MKKNSGITLLALIITIIIMLILAGVTISIVGGSDGIVAKAEKAVSQTDKAAMQEDAELAIASIKMDYHENFAANRAKYANAKAFIVDYLKDEYTTSRGAKMVADSQGNVTYTYKGIATVVAIDDNGKVTLGESSGSGEPSVGEIYYGDSTVVPTDQKYFTFTVNEDGETATITGIKADYGVKAFYQNLEDIFFYCAINDNGTYITDIVIPYEYIDKTGKSYEITQIGEAAFGTVNSKNGYVGMAGFYEEQNYMFTSFFIPNTVNIIGDYAFANGNKLENINIPESVTMIGEGAFKYCINLSSVSMPGVITIDEQAFYECKNLSNVNIPSATDVADNAFWCTSWYWNQTGSV